MNELPDKGIHVHGGMLVFIAISNVTSAKLTWRVCLRGAKSA
jgi:hypothetical protein